MHIVYFQGGFANQLFQYCLYIRLLKKYKKNDVYADISHYKTNNAHGGFKLNQYFKLNFLKKRIHNCIIIDENNYESSFCNCDPVHNYLYVGYWQSESYLISNVGFIKKRLYNRNANSIDNVFLSNIMKNNSIAVHVRRGDYVNHFLHGNISTSAYFYNAIQYANNIVENPVFFVFSDDIEWCKKMFSHLKYNIVFTQSVLDNPVIDMIYMSFCKHFIISNSSYSWWAQKLCENGKRLVVAPYYWFNESINTIELNSDQFVHVNNFLTCKQNYEFPFFSIVIYVYNREVDLKRCLSSVLNQTYTNFEIIIIDDGSDDSSFELLREYNIYDSRIKLIKMDHHKSKVNSLVIAMKTIKGKYSIFLDGNAYLDIEACAKLNKELLINNYDMIEFAYVDVLNGNNRSKKTNLNDFSFKDMLSNFQRFKFFNKAYSKSLIDRVINNFTPIYSDYLDDIYFNIEMLSNIKNYKIVDDVLYYRVFYNNRDTLIFMSEEQLNDMVISLKNCFHYLKNKCNDFDCDLTFQFNKGIKKEIFWLANKCKKSQLPIYDKLRMLLILDNSFGTHFSREYDDEISTVFGTYEKYLSVNTLKKIFWDLKPTIKRLIRKY